MSAPEPAPGLAVLVCIGLLVLAVAFLVGAFLGGDPPAAEALTPTTSRWV